MSGDIKKPNRIYWFSTSDMDYGYYIAARNIREAMAIAKKVGEISDNLSCGEKLEGHYANHKTEHTGELTVKQLIDAGLKLFTCPECDCEEMEINEDSTKYTCKKCNYVGEVPYV